MKILAWHHTPFSLAHGGFQTLVESVMAGLRKAGADVEPLRWWDARQEGTILQFFGRPSDELLGLARAKGYRTVMFETLDATGARSAPALFAQRLLTRAAQVLLPGYTARFGWSAYRAMDALIYAVPRELGLAQYLFGADLSRGHVVPHGVSESALAALSRPAAPGDYLLSIATIHERKNNLLLARAARLAQVPVVFVGKPYANDDPYYQAFLREVDARYVRYEGFVAEERKWELLGGARGFVLLSRFESGCIAVYEAAAAGLPMLLPARPWALTAYPRSADLVFANRDSVSAMAGMLREFAARAGRRARPIFPVLSWDEVARRYLAIYEGLVTTTTRGERDHAGTADPA